jgi:hypothetical protein
MSEGEVVIRAPGREAPGYLRRMRRALELQERAAGRMSLGLLDEMVAFVLAEAEVSAPAGVDVREALLDLSRAEWDGLLRATANGGDAAGVDPQSGA